MYDGFFSVNILPFFIKRVVIMTTPKNEQIFRKNLLRQPRIIQNLP